MPSFKQRTIDFLENEWATYISRFSNWEPAYGQQRVRAQGYDSLRDMLAHILAWWEEGMPIIIAIAEGREYERKKYDYDAFNAQAVSKYKTWPENTFFVHFEKTRQKALVDIRTIDKDDFENRRIQSWINGIYIHHAREHLIALSRFLTLDTLENEWSEIVKKFDALENKQEYLSKQGFPRFEDLLVHVIGWWDEGMELVKKVLADPSYVYEEPDTDKFNNELLEKYKFTSESEIRKWFETKRTEMVKFVRDLPEKAFENETIETWLAADVVEHFDEHAV